jgi:hypothetical protein
MTSFTLLEQTALDAILAEMVEGRAAIEHQLLHTKVVARENTGGGFFSVLQVDPSVQSICAKVPPLGTNVWLAVDGLEFGLGAILHFKIGRASLLEGYAVGPEDTASIDFAKVLFAIIKEPGSFSPNGNFPSFRDAHGSGPLT